jgi:hypothetical protein
VWCGATTRTECEPYPASSALERGDGRGRGGGLEAAAAGGARAWASSPGTVTVRNARAGGLELRWSFKVPKVEQSWGMGQRTRKGYCDMGGRRRGGRSAEESEGWLRTGSAVRGSAWLQAQVAVVRLEGPQLPAKTGPQRPFVSHRSMSVCSSVNARHELLPPCSFSCKGVQCSQPVRSEQLCVALLSSTELNGALGGTRGSTSDWPGALRHQSSRLGRLHHGYPRAHQPIKRLRPLQYINPGETPLSCRIYVHRSRK